MPALPSLLYSRIGQILDNYSDVIEGGTTWQTYGGVASPVSYRGICGLRPNEPALRLSDDTPLTVVAPTATTAFTVGATYSWPTDRWIRDSAPSYFARCYSATQSRNVGAARRITDYNNTTKKFTIDAMPANITAGDVFDIGLGFKRFPNMYDVDISDVKYENGYDRYFKLSVTPGEQTDWYGDNTRTFKTKMSLQVRFLKYAREHDAVSSAFENMAIIRSVLTRSSSPDHRGALHVMALFIDDGAEQKIITNDKDKVIIEDDFALIYRIDTTFK